MNLPYLSRVDSLLFNYVDVQSTRLQLPIEESIIKDTLHNVSKMKLIFQIWKKVALLFKNKLWHPQKKFWNIKNIVECSEHFAVLQIKECLVEAAFNLF